MLYHASAPKVAISWSLLKKPTRRSARRGRSIRGLSMCVQQNPVSISTLSTPRDRDFCGIGTFGPHNPHDNRPGSFQSEETIFATYNNAGVRVFDIKDAFAPKEVAWWAPPAPKKMIDPRPKVTLAAKTADLFVMPDGLMYVTDWNAGLNVLQYEG